MRPVATPPARRSRARTAAALPISSGLGLASTGKRGDVGGPGDAQFTAHYNDWQPWARRYARQITAASFSALVVSDMCARCEVRPELRVESEWVPIEDDPAMANIMEGYANPLQGPDELVRLHAWHYQVAGEMYQVQRDGDGGVEYHIFSRQALEFDKPDDGFVTVKLVPDGKPEKDTAFVVPRDHVVRFWNPDQEWQAYATSPMAAAIDDLHRYRALAKYALKTADSAIAMGGVLWAPGEAFKAPPRGEFDDVAPTDGGTPTSPLEELYYSIAGLRHSNSEDVSAVAPPLFHWDKEYGPPQWIKVGEALDPNGIAFRAEALNDFARAMPIPNTTIEGGGVGDANHWSEWLASDKMFDSAVAPTMNKVTHTDLTASYLWPRAVAYGYPVERLGALRLGYDPSPVIVPPDQSDDALKAYMLGLLGEEPTLRHLNFDPAERMTDPAERARLLEVLAKGRESAGNISTPGAPDTGSGVGPDNVSTAPPERPMAMAAAVDTEDPEVPDGVPFDDRAARRVLDRVVRLRQQLGTRLLAEARHAYDEAMKRAGVNLTNRARSRTSAARQASVKAAVAAREPLAPFLAAVGLREDELLRHAFDTFRETALREFGVYRERIEDLARRAGVADEVAIPSEADGEKAVDYLVAALTAAVRGRLMVGDEAAVLAAVPRMVPRARRRPPSGGDVLPGLPDPDELSMAAARFTREALRIYEGTATYTLPSTPDHPPVVLTIEHEPTIEERLATSLSVETVWTWKHAFYGEPATVFPPHDDLDGFQTTNRDGDPDLYNSEGWPEADLFSPGDHDGCTCEWVPE